MGLKRLGGVLLERGGIELLSELIIDTDKDWQAMGITNLAEATAGMTRGDMLINNGANLVRLMPDLIGRILMSRGVGTMPFWVNEYLPVVLPLSATGITDTFARIRAQCIWDVNVECDGRFRWREVGAALWTETAWQNALRWGDVFYQNLAGLTPATDHEFACQMRNDHGTGEWSELEYFTTL